MIRAFEEAMALTNDTERKNEIQKLKSDYQNGIWITVQLKEELQLLFPSTTI